MVQSQLTKLSPKVLETFPTLVLYEIKGGVFVCAVCLNEFENDEGLLPHYSYVFHLDYLDA